MTCISNTTSTVLYVNNTDAIRYGTYVHVRKGSIRATRRKTSSVVYTYVRRAVLLKKHRTSKKAARASAGHRRARARARRRRTWNRYVLEEGGRASPPRGRAGRLRRGREGRATPGEALGEIFLLHARRFPRRRGGVRGDRAGDVPDALFPPHPRARAGGLRADAARRAAGRARAGARRAARGARRGHRDAGRRRARLFGVGGARCATLGYRGYNHSTCISPNEVVCHGVPSARVVLRAGDIVNVDVAVVTSEGWHGGVSRTLLWRRCRGRRMPPAASAGGRDAGRAQTGAGGVSAGRADR